MNSRLTSKISAVYSKLVDRKWINHFRFNKIVQFMRKSGNFRVDWCMNAFNSEISRIFSRTHNVGVGESYRDVNPTWWWSWQINVLRLVEGASGHAYSLERVHWLYNGLIAQCRSPGMGPHLRFTIYIWPSYGLIAQSRSLALSTCWEGKLVRCRAIPAGRWSIDTARSLREKERERACLR